MLQMLQRVDWARSRWWLVVSRSTNETEGRRDASNTGIFVCHMLWLTDEHDSLEQCRRDGRLDVARTDALGRVGRWEI